MNIYMHKTMQTYHSDKWTFSQEIHSVPFCTAQWHSSILEFLSLAGIYGVLKSLWCLLIIAHETKKSFLPELNFALEQPSPSYSQYSTDWVRIWVDEGH